MSPTISIFKAYPAKGWRQASALAVLTLLTVGVLALVWEFYSEEQVLAFLGSERVHHSRAEPWRHVIALMVFGAIAMAFPFLFAMHSIRARKKAFEALSAAKFEVELASKSKGMFLAHMSHELRTPLNAILGFGEIIRDAAFGRNDPRYAEYAANIVSSADHLLALINDVLDFSKLEHAQSNLDAALVSIEEISRASIALVSAQAKENGVRLRYEIQDCTLALRADPQKLRQILVNLLSNAVKFTPSGGNVLLKAWRDTDAKFVFQVRDTGIGMSREDLSKALSPFQQIDNPFNRKYPGTGLGLPIVKSLVELHDGTLKLESVAGEGTVVTICLPNERSPQQLDTEPRLSAASGL